MSNAHHIHGPSSLERRMLCPGSARMESGRPDEASDAANEGSMLHAIMAGTGDENALNIEQQDLIASCRAFLADISEDWTETLVEQRLGLIGPDYSEVTYGTADVVGIAPERVEVVDWKFGMLPVENPGENPQLAAYAAMAMQRYGRKRCVAHVFQPRLGRHESFEFTDANGIAANIAAIIARCEEPDAPLVPGLPQCRYCRAAVDCPAANGTVGALADVETTVGDVADLSPDQLCALYEQWQVAKKVGDRLERRIRKIAAENGACGRLTVARRSGARRIEDPAAAFVALDGGLDQEEFLAATTVSVAKLEGAYIAKHAERTEDGVKVRGEATRLKGQLAGMLGELVTVGSDVESIVAVAPDSEGAA